MRSGSALGLSLALAMVLAVAMAAFVLGMAYTYKLGTCGRVAGRVYAPGACSCGPRSRSARSI